MIDHRIGKMEPLYDLIRILNFENHRNFYITGWLSDVLDGLWTVSFCPSQKRPFAQFGSAHAKLVPKRHCVGGRDPIEIRDDWTQLFRTIRIIFVAFITLNLHVKW